MKNETKEIRYFSMFTGVGGFELGLERANNDKFNTETQNNNERNKSNTSECNGNGRRTYPNGIKFKPVGFSEIDKYASELLTKKFPNIKNYGDATKINPSELPDFDMLCGGFPCQAFSIAGKRRGFEDTRGTMFFEVARILEVKRPRLVFLENVKGLLNHNKGETFSVIIQTLEELGYRTQWMVLNSKFFGVPQNRERVFIIGSLRGEPRPEILPFRTGNYEDFEQSEKPSATITSRYSKQGNADPYITHPSITGAIGRQGSSKEYMRSLQKINEAESQGMRVYDTKGVSSTLAGNAGGLGGKTGLYAIPVLTPNRIDKRQNGRRFKEPEEPSFTLTGQDIMKIRRLTPTECERLQGFPDGWTEGFSDTQRYKMMGNAVTTNVIQVIGEKLLFAKTRGNENVN